MNAPWPWEGAVQDAFAHHLENHGWTITRLADTASKERGVDILAEHNSGRRLAAEVKGYPSTTYADPARAAETKRTKPTTQVRTWVARAAYTGLALTTSHPDHDVLLVLADHPRTRALITPVDDALKSLEIHVDLVDQPGTCTSQTWSL